MRLITLMLLAVALPAFAADPVVVADEKVSITPLPADAPKADLDAPGRALVLEEGSITPYTGVLLDAQEDISRERSRVRCAAALDDAKANAWVSPPVLVGLIVGGLVLGAAAGVGVTFWALKK